MDVTPSNVHLEAWGSGELVKVLDFGVAKLVRGRAKTHPGDLCGELTLVGQIVGTPEYMAPEQLVGDTVDRRADIYALGVTLYEMLTSMRPFEMGEGGDVLLSLIARRDAPRPSALVTYAPRAIADKLDAIIMRCLAPLPRDRFANVADVIESLELVVRAAQPWRTDSTAVRRFPRGSCAEINVESVECDASACSIGEDHIADDDRTSRTDLRRLRVA